MIEGRELRIGNLIRNDAGTICPVTSLLERDGVLQIGAACQPVGKFDGWVEEFEYIPLTREILEKCNYAALVEIFDNVQVRSDRVVFRIKENNIQKFYLHQLQNFYHSLIGTELTINL